MQGPSGWELIIILILEKMKKLKTSIQAASLDDSDVESRISVKSNPSKSSQIDSVYRVYNCDMSLTASSV